VRSVFFQLGRLKKVRRARLRPDLFISREPPIKKFTEY
jgi:hypothetical protein